MIDPPHTPEHPLRGVFISAHPRLSQREWQTRLSPWESWHGKAVTERVKKAVCFAQMIGQDFVSLHQGGTFVRFACERRRGRMQRARKGAAVKGA